jgi:hypothetical protein
MVRLNSIITSGNDVSFDAVLVIFLLAIGVLELVRETDRLALAMSISASCCVQIPQESYLQRFKTSKTSQVGRRRWKMTDVSLRALRRSRSSACAYNRDYDEPIGVTNPPKSCYRTCFAKSVEFE